MNEQEAIEEHGPDATGGAKRPIMDTKRPISRKRWRHQCRQHHREFMMELAAPSEPPIYYRLG